MLFVRQIFCVVFFFFCLPSEFLAAAVCLHHFYFIFFYLFFEVMAVANLISGFLVTHFQQALYLYLFSKFWFGFVFAFNLHNLHLTTIFAFRIFFKRA